MKASRKYLSSLLGRFKTRKLSAPWQKKHKTTGPVLGPQLKLSSDRMGEPEIKLGTPGYKAIDLSTCINKKIFTILHSFCLSGPLCQLKVSKGAKIRNQYNHVPHLTQNTNGKVTNSQLYTTNKSQEVSPFPAGDHKPQINRHAQRHNKHKTENI